ncbi:MAG: GGDEF domain-containing protein [Lachnospiraceae bacterium]|nr:GGDEF domain-containing protein [Lachnospiraceae bacterium]
MREKGIHLRALSYFLLSAAVVIGLISICGMVNVYAKYKDMLESSLDYGNARDSIDRLKEGSDYLTEQVRQYVITGDKTYMDNYFYEANVRKRRDKAVEQIINDMDIGETTIDALKQALAESNELMKTEFHAMKLAAFVDRIPESQMPEEIRNWELTEEEKAMGNVELVRMAGNLVFDRNYAVSKENINDDLLRALNTVESSMRTNLNESAGILEGTLAIQLILTLLLILLSAGAVAAIFVLVIGPLNRYDRNISKGEPLEVSGSLEFRRLAETYNTILAQNKESRKRLKYKAEHDELTKLLNRTAFDKLCDSLAKEESPFALLIIDVDNFKKVNDTYGHAKGDEALIRVGRRLMNTFRSDDYCVRYGGDEFVVLMTGVSASASGTVIAKIEEINEGLRKTETAETPPVTLSVGVAFSNNGYSTGLFADADKALYYTKENGRSGYTFFDEIEMHYHVA